MRGQRHRILPRRRIGECLGHAARPTTLCKASANVISSASDITTGSERDSPARPPAFQVFNPSGLGEIRRVQFRGCDRDMDRSVTHAPQIFGSAPLIKKTPDQQSDLFKNLFGAINPAVTLRQSARALDVLNAPGHEERPDRPLERSAADGTVRCQDSGGLTTSLAAANSRARSVSKVFSNSYTLVSALLSTLYRSTPALLCPNV